MCGNAVGGEERAFWMGGLAQILLAGAPNVVLQQCELFSCFGYSWTSLSAQ